MFVSSSFPMYTYCFRECFERLHICNLLFFPWIHLCIYTVLSTNVCALWCTNMRGQVHIVHVSLYLCDSMMYYSWSQSETPVGNRRKSKEPRKRENKNEGGGNNTMEARQGPTYTCIIYFIYIYTCTPISHACTRMLCINYIVRCMRVHPYYHLISYIYWSKMLQKCLKPETLRSPLWGLLIFWIFPIVSGSFRGFTMWKCAKG